MTAVAPAPVAPDAGARLSLHLHPLVLPAALLGALGVPVLAGLWLLPADRFQVLWRQPPLLTSEHKGWATVILLGSIAVAALAAHALPRHTVLWFPQQVVDRLGTATRVMFGITVTAYVVWLLIGVTRGLTPGHVVDVLAGSNGAVYTLREQILAPIGGVTTWMQIGVLAGPLAVLRSRLTGRSARPMILVLLGLAAVRTVLVSERLALIEVGLAIGIAVVVTSARVGRHLSLTRVVGYYAVALALLYAVFAVFEYVRSWSTHYAERYPAGFLQFAYERLLGYYATAANNAVLAEYVSDGRRGWLLLGGDYGAELGIPFAESAADAREEYGFALSVLSNPEFNNQSGIVLSAIALPGVVAALVWAALALTAVGMLRSATRGSLTALAFYPCWSVGFLEAFRIFYFGQSRFVIVVVALALLASLIGGRGRPVATRPEPAPPVPARPVPAPPATGPLPPAHAPAGDPPGPPASRVLATGAVDPAAERSTSTSAGP